MRACGVPGFGTQQSPLGVELEASGDTAKAVRGRVCLNACPKAAARLEEALDHALRVVGEDE